MTVLEPAASRIAALPTACDSGLSELEEALATLEASLDLEEEELDVLGLGDDELGRDGEAEEEELGFVELVDFDFGEGELEALLLAELDELGTPSSLLFSLVVSLSLAFPPSFSLLACSFAIFSFSAVVGFEEELELELVSSAESLVLTAADADGEEEAPAAGGSG